MDFVAFILFIYSIWLILGLIIEHIRGDMYAAERPTQAHILLNYCSKKLPPKTK